jgi:hypothetical protein
MLLMLLLMLLTSLVLYSSRSGGGGGGGVGGGGSGGVVMSAHREVRLQKLPTPTPGPPSPAASVAVAPWRPSSSFTTRRLILRHLLHHRITRCGRELRPDSLETRAQPCAASVLRSVHGAPREQPESHRPGNAAPLHLGLAPGWHFPLTLFCSQNKFN